MSNNSIVGFNMAELLPAQPREGATLEETVQNLLDFTIQQQAAIYEIMGRLNTLANLGFQAITDGTNTQFANENGTITLQATDAATVTLAGGVMTFSSSDTTYTGEEMVSAINAQATKIQAGKIAITQISHFNATEGAKLAGIATGADVTTSVLSSTVISAGKINLSTSTFDGTLPTTKTAAKCTDATANNTTTALESTVTITSGGITMSAGGKIMGGKTSYPDAATAGYYLGYDPGTSKYVFRAGNSTKYIDWDGTTLTIRGTLVADDITSGTLTLTDGSSYSAIVAPGYIKVLDSSNKIIMDTSGREFQVGESAAAKVVKLYGTVTIYSGSTAKYTFNPSGVFTSANAVEFETGDHKITMNSGVFKPRKYTGTTKPSFSGMGSINGVMGYYVDADLVPHIVISHGDAVYQVALA